MINMEKIVRDSLEDFLRSIGRTIPPMDPDTRPIPDLGLDTREEVDWLCDVEELGVHVPHAFRAFVTEDGKRMRSIKEIAELLERSQTGAVKAK